MATENKAKMNKFVILAVIMLVLVILLSAFWVIRQIPLASTPAPVLKNVTTTVLITGIPDDDFWLGQLVHFRVEIDPAPPTANDSFTNYTFTVTLPDKTTENIVEDAANSTISFAVGGNVIDDYLNLYPEVGAFTLKVDFLGHAFGNGVYYLPSENETSIDITAEPSSA